MKKKSKIKSLVIAVMVACFGAVGLLAMPASAVTIDDAYCKQTFGNSYEAKGGTCIEPGERGNLWDVVSVIIKVILTVVGVIAVVMIIIGGLQYTTSAGDSGKVKKAKDTILYGVVGLVISLLAFAIVNFVLDSIFSSNSNNTTNNNTTTGP